MAVSKPSLEDKVKEYVRNSDLGPLERAGILNCVASLDEIPCERPEMSSNINQITTHLVQVQGVAQHVLPVLNMAKNIPIPKLKLVLQVVTTLLQAVLNTDIMSMLEKPYKKALLGPFAAKCRSTSRKITHFVSYAKGMPDGELTDERIRILLQQLAADFPLHDTMSAVLELSESIRQKVEVADTKKFEELMLNIDLYCSLTTYVEFYFLYRIAIQERYGLDPSPILEVFKALRNTDEEVLSFIHKPTTKTFKLHYICNLSDWQVTEKFVSRRKLLPESLGDLNGQKICLRPVEGQNKAIHLSKKWTSDSKKLYLHTTERTAFKLTSCSMYNTFQIEDDDGKYLKWSDSRLRVKNAGPNEDSRKWHIVKIHPETHSEPSAYMIWLEANRRACLSVGYFGRVSSFCSDAPDRYYLWQFVS